MKKKVGLKTWEMAFKFHHFASMFLVAWAIVSLYQIRDIITSFNYYYFIAENAVFTENKSSSDGNSSQPCDFYLGSWIYDKVSYPLYEETQCSFLKDSFACEKYGRKDLKYQNWRWQPHHCNIPMFNGTALLEKLRGKKLLFVGDSMMRNQWTSMLCLIDSSLPASSDKRVIHAGNTIYFHDNEYNATIGVYWSPYLVESNCDDQSKRSVPYQLVRIKAIEKHARNWNDADFLVFDSYGWWLNPPNITILWGPFESDDAIYKDVVMKPRYYEMALNTWSDWLEVNINRSKTKLFFMSASPFIFRGDVLRSCYNVSEPSSKREFFSSSRMNLMDVAEETMRKLERRGIKVVYLRISDMSAYRRDAHPSIYRNFYNRISEEDRKKPMSYSDCIHWCLPGVPDVWNQMLYAHIVT